MDISILMFVKLMVFDIVKNGSATIHSIRRKYLMLCVSVEQILISVAKELCQGDRKNALPSLWLNYLKM